MEVWVEAFLQPFGNLLHIFLVNMFHKTLEVGLKNMNNNFLSAVNEVKL